MQFEHYVIIGLALLLIYENRQRVSDVKFYRKMVREYANRVMAANNTLPQYADYKDIVEKEPIKVPTPPVMVDTSYMPEPYDDAPTIVQAQASLDSIRASRDEPV
jgi:hypothetical protein